MNTGDWFGQLLRYGVVGLALNGLGYLLYLALTFGAGADPLWVVGVLYPVSVAASFFLNRRWTFNHSGSASRSLGRFVMAHVGGYLLNLGLLWLFWSWLGLPHPLVQAAAIFIVAAYLFMVFRIFVFHPEHDDPASPA